MDIINKQFGRLTVIKNSNKIGYVTCKCSCGNIVDIRATSLTKSKQPTKSCGCIQKEKAKLIGNQNIKSNSENQIKINMTFNTNFQMIERETPIKSNTSGCTGVSYNKQRNNYEAYIQVHGKRIRLGRFKYIEDAIKARKEAEEKYFKPLIEIKNMWNMHKTNIYYLCILYIDIWKQKYIIELEIETANKNIKSQNKLILEETKMKYIAKQINPEYQESPMNYDEYENLFIVSARDCYGVNEKEYNEFIEKLDNVFDSIDDGFGAEYWQYENLAECLHFELYDGDSTEMTDELVEKWEKFFENYHTTSDICEALEIFTGDEWNCKEIHGCCQGDWACVVYNLKHWNDENIKNIEIEYFNLGTDWMINENGVEETELESDDFDLDNYDGCCYYVYSWDVDGQREELANIIGCNASDVVMFAHDGYITKSKYKIV